MKREILIFGFLIFEWGGKRWAEALLALRRASRSAAYNISGNSQAIPELFLAQDQVVGYLLKIVVEPR